MPSIFRNSLKNCQTEKIEHQCNNAGFNTKNLSVTDIKRPVLRTETPTDLGTLDAQITNVDIKTVSILGTTKDDKLNRI